MKLDSAASIASTRSEVMVSALLPSRKSRFPAPMDRHPSHALAVTSSTGSMPTLQWQTGSHHCRHDPECCDLMSSASSAHFVRSALTWSFRNLVTAAGLLQPRRYKLLLGLVSHDSSILYVIFTIIYRCQAVEFDQNYSVYIVYLNLPVWLSKAGIAVAQHNLLLRSSALCGWAGL